MVNVKEGINKVKYDLLNNYQFCHDVPDKIPMNTCSFKILTIC